jgi:hypothetical protein
MNVSVAASAPDCDGRRVDEQGVGTGGRDELVPVRGEHVRALGQHCKDDVRSFDSCRTTCGNSHAPFAGVVDGSSNEVEAGDLVSGLDQVRGHRATHVSEADKCDTRAHVSVRFFSGGRRHRQP